MKIFLGFFAIGLLSIAAAGEMGDGSPMNTAKEFYSLCATSNSILSTQMDDDVLGQIVRSETQRHADAARHLGVSDDELIETIRHYKDAYNNGEKS